MRRASTRAVALDERFVGLGLGAFPVVRVVAPLARRAGRRMTRRRAGP